jgi:hypothetical protein
MMIASSLIVPFFATEGQTDKGFVLFIFGFIQPEVETEYIYFGED